MYKNWNTICKIANPWLKMLLVTCDDEKVLVSLRIGFPEYFSDVETNLRIPLSGLLQLVHETEGGMWDDVISDLNIPSFDWGSSINAVAEQVPPDWHHIAMDAIKGADHDYYVFESIAGGHYEIEWNDEVCILVDAAAYGATVPESITLVPKRFIDFSS